MSWSVTYIVHTSDCDCFCLFFFHLPYSRCIGAWCNHFSCGNMVFARLCTFLYLMVFDKTHAYNFQYIVIWFLRVEFTLTPYLVQYGVRASVDWMFLFLFTTANSHDFTSHWNKHLEITWEIEFEPFDMFEMQFAIEAKSEPIQIDDVLFRASVSLHYNQELCSTNETICVCAAVTTFLSFILSSTMTVRIVMYSCI